MMPRGAGRKREREYEKLKKDFKKSGRYRGREEEVAARIVNKQRAQYGETKHARRQEAKGESPDQNLPIASFRHLTIPEVKRKLENLNTRQLKKLKHYELGHKNRKSLLKALDQRLIQ